MRARWKSIALGVLLAVLAAPAAADPGISYLLDFTDYDEGLAEDWLKAKGFAFKSDADDRRRVNLGVSEQGLMIENKRRARTLLVNERVDVAEFRTVRITWKVDRYPEGANYDAGVRNEALMVMVFFGHEKVSSGSFLIPDSPYFIGMFLCRGGAVGTPYVGRYFQKGGRYVCLDQPGEGQVVTSELDLLEAFKQYFDADDVPVVSGVALQADTTDSEGGGKAMATITKVEFLEKD